MTLLTALLADAIAFAIDLPAGLYEAPVVVCKACQCMNSLAGLLGIPSSNVPCPVAPTVAAAAHFVHIG
jgi:hypothetical protein